MLPRYPIYIPSKGRWNHSITAMRLREIGLDFFVVVEDSEADKYERTLGKENILTLPFNNLGKGSIPARNWIWEHAAAAGHKRHWVIDDNIARFYRLNFNRRIPVRTGSIFRCVEDFSDRYENVAISGFGYMGLTPDRDPRHAPFILNARVYSMILMATDLPYRWRGRYNEDTDICLRALKDGHCTVLFNIFLGDKTTTLMMEGGNTDTVYATGDHRREFAESLVRQHPDVARVVWKFGRWHHEVDYRRFKKNTLRLREGVTPTNEVDEYGMRLVRRPHWSAILGKSDLSVIGSNDGEVAIP
jgi:hypothetical protein